SGAHEAPKSTSLTHPAGVRRTLCGLMSQCAGTRRRRQVGRFGFPAAFARTAVSSWSDSGSGDGLGFFSSAGSASSAFTAGKECAKDAVPARFRLGAVVFGFFGLAALSV